MIAKLFYFAVICLLGVTAKRDTEALERHCKSPPSDAMLDQEWVQNGVPIGGWYLPLISKSATRTNAGDELLHTISPVRNVGRAFCPRLRWLPEMAIVSYYDQEFVFHCSSETIPSQQCVRNVTGSTDKISKPPTVDNSITFTDNQSYIFVYRCWEDGHRDWVVISPMKILSEETKEIILKEAEFIGFDKNEYYEVTYKNCEEK